MENNKKLLCFVFLITFTIIGFSQESKTQIHKVKVLEVKQVSSYTYLLINDNSIEKWLSTPTIEAEIGDVFFYTGGMEMSDFKSPELEITFISVLFLSRISKNQEDVEAKAFQHSFAIDEQTTTKNSIEKLSNPINPVNGGISIAELLENKHLYEGKTIKIKGQVIKFIAQVMSKNWVHLQDGTEFNGKFDVTFTTNARVNIGDIILLEGKVALDKDFGFGYFYELIIENSQLIDI